jgi:hypothetical protein
MTLFYHPVGGGSAEVDGGELAVRDGPNPPATLDAAALLTGTFTARVTQNGEPCALRSVRLHGPIRKELRTDHRGRFEAVLPAGDYRVTVALSGEERPAWLRWPQVVTVVRGQRPVGDVSLTTSRLELLVTTSAGAPAAGVRLLTRGRDGDFDGAVSLPPTSGAGAVAVDLPAGRCTFHTTTWSPLGGEEVGPELGSATIAMGRTTKLELRLPKP